MRPSPAPISSAPDVAFAPPEVVEVQEHRVMCDGVGGALGHPRVYMEMGSSGFVECGYCDRRFVLAGHVHAEDPLADPGDYQGQGGQAGR